MTEHETIESRAGKYLTFQLGSEDYGIGIFSVKEIIGMVPVTAVPLTPPFVKGVIILRDKVIQVIDLHCLFEMTPVDYTERTCIIIMEKIADDGTVSRAGVVVDAVSEVIHINEDMIEDAPEFSQQAKSRAILGMAKVENGLKILIDMNKALQQTGYETIEIAV